MLGKQRTPYAVNLIPAKPRPALHHPNAGNPNADVAAFYRKVLALLNREAVRYMIGGGYAMEIYTRVRRATKDIDVFLLPQDVSRTFELLERAGYRTELTEEHWLGKAFHGDQFIDVIFGAGNGLGQVDEDWLTHAVDSRVLGVPVKLCAAEEMIWHKGFVMARDRYDGADVAHLLIEFGEGLDWPRLLGRFRDHWRVLLSHLVLFGYVYPGHRDLVPPWVQQLLLSRLEQETIAGDAMVDATCRGPFLSRADYRQAIEHWGYQTDCPAPLVLAGDRESESTSSES